MCWHAQRKVWRVKLCIKGRTVIGGSFNHELDAAKRVNQLCEELGIPAQNPAHCDVTSTIPVSIR